MNCRIARRRIPLLIGNDLSPKEAEPVEEHVADCDSCQRHVEDLLNSSDALMVYGAEALNQRKTSVWNNVSEQLPERPETPARTRSGVQSVLMVAAVLGIMALGILPDVIARNQSSDPSTLQVVNPDAVNLPAGEYVRHYDDQTWQALESLDGTTVLPNSGRARNVGF